MALGQPNEALKKYQFHYEVAGEMQDKREICQACYGLGLAFQVPDQHFHHSSLCKPCQNQIALGILYSYPAPPRSIFIFSRRFSLLLRIRPDRKETKHEGG